jgi:hypothetical protein
VGWRAGQGYILTAAMRKRSHLRVPDFQART